MGMRALNGLRCSAPRFVALASACWLAATLAACGGGSDLPHSGSAGSGGAPGGAGNGSGAVGNVGPGNLKTASASVARRLSRTEYSNVMRDVLGDSTSAINKYLSEDEYRPFDNDYTVQAASRALIESLEAAADDIAARAVLPENRAKTV